MDKNSKSLDAKDEETVSRFLTFQLHQLTQKLSAQARIIIAHHDPDLTLPQWRIIRVVGMGFADGSTPVRKACGLDKGQFSKTLAQIVGKSLVTVSEHSTDRRQSNLALTHAGQALYERIAPELTQRNELLLASLPARERRTIYDTIKTLSAAAEITEF